MPLDTLADLHLLPMDSKDDEFLLYENLPDLPPPSWLVKDLIPETGITIIGGETGTQKSFFAQEITSAVLNNRLVAGHFEVLKPGMVVYIDIENGYALVRQRLSGLGPVPKNMLYLQNNDLVFDLRGEKLQDAIKIFIETINPVLVVIDTLRSAWSGDENKSDDVNLLHMNLLGPLSLDRAVILVTHTKKRQQDRNNSDELGDVRGSSDITGKATCVLTLRKTLDSVNVYNRKIRFALPIKPFSLRLKTEGEKFCYEYIGEAAEDLTKEQDCINQLRDWLKATFRPGTQLTTKEITSGFQEQHNFQKTSISNSIAFLRNRDFLRRERQGIYTLIFGDDSLVNYSK